MTIKREIAVYPDRTEKLTNIEVNSGATTGWISVDISDTDKFTMFLSAQQMEDLGEQLKATAAAWRMREVVMA